MLTTVKNFLRPVKRMVERAAGREPIGRAAVARHFLVGHGLEVGALHNPLKVPSTLKVRYVDRMTVDDLRHHYPELKELPLVPLDVIDDGERLTTFPDASEDFVIANHFLEHCQDPIGTIKNVMRVLKPGGVFFLTVPDKRSTFDRDRAITAVEHMAADFEQGPEASRAGHFREMVEKTQGLTGDAGEAELQRLLAIDYSIHFHVWDAKAFLRLLLEASTRADFDIEFTLVSGIEIISVLRKAGGAIERVRDASARDMLAISRKTR